MAKASAGLCRAATPRETRPTLIAGSRGPKSTHPVPPDWGSTGRPGGPPPEGRRSSSISVAVPSRESRPTRRLPTRDPNPSLEPPASIGSAAAVLPVRCSYPDRRPNPVEGDKEVQTRPLGPHSSPGLPSQPPPSRRHWIPNLRSLAWNSRLRMPETVASQCST